MKNAGEPAEFSALCCFNSSLMTPLEATTGSWKTDIEESLAREQRASKLYLEFAARATTPRLREVWEAVSVVEADHIALDNVALTLA